MEITETIATRIIDRVHKRVPIAALQDLGILNFYVGGNSLNKSPPNDIDIYPTGKLSLGKSSFERLDFDNIPVLSTTKNATTIRLGGTIVQLCNYLHPSLKELVDSFDYAHIQIGAEINDRNVTSVYYSDHWRNAHLLEDTWFCGSEYPLSSLIRSYKYKDRGNFAGNSHIYSVLNIIGAIVERGFTSYEDFKDQLDAVDLGLVPEEFDEVGRSQLQKLYSVLSKEPKREDMNDAV